MKEKLTISEMARLRGLTPETLRHYDRIGLFKPHHVDIDSGYRYYSIFQYEVLGTIKELREIGMSTEEIKNYFNERNVSNSLSILERKHIDLIDRINELNEIEKSIQEKISWMREISKSKELMEVSVRELPIRSLIVHHDKVQTNLELCYGVIELENKLNEKAPIVGTNRLGVLIDKADLDNHKYNSSCRPFILERIKKKVKEHKLITIPHGKYVCIRYSGELWDRARCLEKAMHYIKENHFEIIGYTLQIAQIDISVTDVIDELVFELQIPIKHS